MLSASTNIGDEPKRAWGVCSSSFDGLYENFSATTRDWPIEALTLPDASAAPLFCE